MKKFGIFLLMLLMATALMAGCNNGNGTVSNTTGSESNSNTQTESVQPSTALPTFEELVALNSYENILKTHSTLYMKNTCTAANAEENYVEDAIFFQGNGKIDYHMRHTNTANGIIEDLSRVGQQWYYYNVNDASYAVLELGKTYVLDYTIPDMFDCDPMGKAYIDGDYIVHHASVIYEGSEEYSARRRDFVFYFDKETKMIKQTTATLYNNNHEVIATYVIDYTYNVKVEDVFETTLLDSVNADEKRIDLEIIVDYNTADQKTYSLTTTTDAILYAVIDSETYMLYTDTEFKNEITTLEAFADTKNMMLYAKKMEFAQ